MGHVPCMEALQDCMVTKNSFFEGAAGLFEFVKLHCHFHTNTNKFMTDLFTHGAWCAVALVIATAMTMVMTAFSQAFSRLRDAA